MNKISAKLALFLLSSFFFLENQKSCNRQIFASFASSVCQGGREGWVLQEGPGWSWFPNGNFEAKAAVFSTGNPTTSNYQTNIMNACNKFDLTDSHMFCYYLHLTRLMLGACLMVLVYASRKITMTQPLACSAFFLPPPPAPPGEWERELGKKR